MSFEFFNVDAGDVSRRRALSDDASPTDDSDVAIDPFPRKTVPPANEQVAYYHPRGCGANGSDCDDDKIKNICHNNEKDAEAFPIDGVFFSGKIRPPFLKGVYYDEKIDEDGNTHNDDGKVQRTHSGKTIKPGRGVCYNDADDGEDGLRAWTDSKMRDPTNKKDVVFLSKATTARQRVRPMFAEAMRAVRDDFDILPLVGGHHFFRPPVIVTLDEQGWQRTVPDRLLKKAQGLAEVCGARPRENTTEEEKVAFEELKREKFDELYPMSGLNRNLSSGSEDDVPVSFVRGLIQVADATGFTHGKEWLGRSIEHHVARARPRRGTVRAWLGSDKEPRAMVFDAKGERLSVGFSNPDHLGTQEFGKTQGVVRFDADTGLQVGNLSAPPPDRVPGWDGRETFMLESSFSSNGERVALYGETAYQYAQIYRGDAFEAEIRIGVDEEDPSGLISSVTFDGNGEMLAGVFHPFPYKKSTDKKPTVKIWKRDSNGWNPTPWKTLAVDNSPFSVAFSPDGARLAIASHVTWNYVSEEYDVSTHVWNLDDQTPGSLVEVGGWPFAGIIAKEVAFSADGERLGIRGNEFDTFEVRESTNGGTSWGTTRSVFVKEGVSEFAFNPQNSTLLALVVDGNVDLMSTLGDGNDDTGGHLLKRFKNARGPLAFSPDGTRLAMVTRRDNLIVVENIIEHVPTI